MMQNVTQDSDNQALETQALDRQTASHKPVKSLSLIHI